MYNCTCNSSPVSQWLWFWWCKVCLVIHRSSLDRLHQTWVGRLKSVDVLFLCICWASSMMRRSDEPAAVCPECGCSARLVSGTRRYDRITPVLQELHWLPVRHRVDVKMACTLVYLSLSGMAIAYLGLPVTVRHGSSLPWSTCHCPTWLQLTLVYPSLSDMAPAYLAADCQLVSDEGRRRLHSANSRMCHQTDLQPLWLWRQRFAAAGPKLWNSLPPHLRQTDIDFEQFKQLLKTFLFECWDRIAFWLTVKSCLSSPLTTCNWTVQVTT